MTDLTVGCEPDRDLAARIAGSVVGRVPSEIKRFTTGARHYVYEAIFADRDPVVVRIGGRSAHAEMAGAERLSRLLRPRGLPLPAILGRDSGAELPWLVLQRLPGTDLGAVINSLSDAKLEGIAAGVVAAQAITGTTASAGYYGYAVAAEQAPCERWSQVLERNLDRSRDRIVSAGLFDPTLVDSVRWVLAARRKKIDQVSATPFLHDTTTKNVIVAPDGILSGIVDVDDLCFGDPRYAAALTLASLTVHGGPTRYVSAWLRHAGAEDDATFRLYVALFFFDLMAEHGQVFNGNEGPSTSEARVSLKDAFDANYRFLVE